jgi:hypothetical protein
MRSSKVAIWTTLGVLALFALQFGLVYRVPYWGLRSQFPFSVLRSVEMPLVLAVGFATMVFSTKSVTERRLFYSVIGASLAEIVTIKVMLWLSQPLLLLVVFFLNAFMTVQILRYGVLVYAVEPS